VALGVNQEMNRPLWVLGMSTFKSRETSSAHPLVALNEAVQTGIFTEEIGSNIDTACQLYQSSGLKHTPFLPVVTRRKRKDILKIQTFSSSCPPYSWTRVLQSNFLDCLHSHHEDETETGPYVLIFITFIGLQLQLYLLLSLYVSYQYRTF